MKQTILGIDLPSYKKKLKASVIICIATTVIILALNVLFVCLRTDQNHKAMLVINVALDILGGWFVTAYLSLVVLPRRKLCKLYQGQRSLCRGVVVQVSCDTQTVLGLECYSVTVGSDSERLFFLPKGKLFVEPNQSYLFAVVSNVIVEVEQA